MMNSSRSTSLLLTALVLLVTARFDSCHAWVAPFATISTRPVTTKPTFQAALKASHHQQDEEGVATATNSKKHSITRRDWLQTTAVALTAFTTITATSTGLPPAALAAAEEEEIVYYDPAEVQKAFDAIRFELQDPKGGVATMQAAVDAVDYDGLFEFTKTYDLEMRKAKMMTAKKKFKISLANKAGVDPQQLLNNVTFDLIGMNKSCRQGQQNITTTQKYLTELKDDMAKFIELQSTILLAQ